MYFNVDKYPIAILDTNVFYDFCYMYGFYDFGFIGKANPHVNYDNLESILETHLINKSLFISSATIFEVIGRFRNNDALLRKLMVFLWDISQKYSYNLFAFYTIGGFFSFGKETDNFWNEVSKDYMKLVENKEMIFDSKIQSEADVLLSFARIIIYCYLNGVSKGDKEIEEKAKQYINFHQRFPKGYKIYSYEKSKCCSILDKYYNQKIKIIDCFDLLLNEVFIEADMYMNPGFDRIDIPEGKALIEVIDLKKVNAVRKIHRWFCDNRKHINISDLLKNIYFEKELSNCQMGFINKSINMLFNNCKKVKKNDTEDFWNMGYIYMDKSYLITFEKSIIELMIHYEKNNYKYISQFYTQ